MTPETLGNQESDDKLEYNLDNKLNPELKIFLEDKNLNSDEAKALTEIFDANKVGILDVSKENLDNLRTAINSKSKRSYITGTEKKIIRKISKSEDINIGVSEEILTERNNNIKTVDVELDKKKETKEEKINTNDIPDTNEVETKYSRIDIIRQAKKLSENEVKILQAYLGFTYSKGLDGNFGKGTFKRYSEKNPNWPNESLNSFIENNKEVLDKYKSIVGYPKLNSREDFETKYGELSSKLSENLDLPTGIINAIIKKESTFGQNLNSSTGSKGIMQLTIWPLKDMKGDDSKKIDGKWVRRTEHDTEKVESYRNIFKKINFEDLKSIDMGDGSTIEDTLTPDIWDKLGKLQNEDVSTNEAINIIKEFKQIIKSPKNKYSYFHTLNMIIGSVYYSRLYSSAKGNEESKIKTAAERYNGDASHKKTYARLVYKNYLNEQKK